MSVYNIDFCHSKFIYLSHFNFLAMMHTRLYCDSNNKTKIAKRELQINLYK